MFASLNLRSVAAIVAQPLLATIAMLAVATTAHTQVISTWNGTSGDWTNAALWSTNPFYPNNGNPPGATYAVEVGLTPGTLTINVPIEVQSLRLLGGNTRTFAGSAALTVLGETFFDSASGIFNVPLNTGSLRLSQRTLGGSGPIAVSGFMSVSDAVLDGSGPVTVAGGFGLGGLGQFIIDGRSLTLTGGMGFWNGDSIRLQNRAVFTVGTGATLTSTRTFGMTATPGGTFAVNGTYTVDTSTFGTQSISNGVTVTNAGTIDLRRNPGPFGALGGLTNTGRVRVAAGQTWQGQITSSGPAATVTGAGTFEPPSPGLTGLIFNGGRLAPGDGVGSMLVLMPITMGPGSILEVQLGGPIPAAYDRLLLNRVNTTGSITLNGSSLNTLVEYAPTPADILTIVSGGPVIGTFTGLPNGTEFLVGRFNNTDYVGTITYTSSSIILSNIHAVPEPAAWLLTGAAGFAWTWRRHRSRRMPNTNCSR